MRNFPGISAWITGMMISLLLICRVAWATPVEVTLFPEVAKVSEASRTPVRSEGKRLGKTLLVLPGGAQPETLKIILDDPDLKISNISWRSLAPGGLAQNDARQKQLRNLTEERKRLTAVIKGLENQISFWQSQTKAKTKTLNDALNLSAAISRNTKKAWQEKLTLEGECEKLDQRIGVLKEEEKKGQDTAGSDWEVSLSLTGLRPEKKDIALKYSYALSNCGWTSLYRLEGRPGQERVEFSWDAEVWQNSRQDWNGVALSLAIQPVQNVTAPEKLPEWKIASQKTGSRRSSGKEEKGNTTVAPARNPVAPFVRFLGQQSLSSGRKQVLPVESASWPATFSRVLMPFSRQDAAIRAEVVSPSPLQIPENPALMMLDGVFLGRQDFGFSGQEKKLLFGSDPSVSAEVKMVAEPGSAPKIEGVKQVWDWRWQTVVKNEGSTAVKVRIEEPVPQIRDRRIKVEVQGEPAFSEGQPAIGSRELELSPGGSRTLETTVHIEAPRDMTVDMSWIP